MPLVRFWVSLFTDPDPVDRIKYFTSWNELTTLRLSPFYYRVHFSDCRSVLLISPIYARAGWVWVRKGDLGHYEELWPLNSHMESLIRSASNLSRNRELHDLCSTSPVHSPTLSCVQHLKVHSSNRFHLLRGAVSAPLTSHATWRRNRFERVTENPIWAASLLPQRPPNVHGRRVPGLDSWLLCLRIRDEPRDETRP